MNSPARVIGFVNAAHFIDHYSMLIFAAAVIVMGPALGMTYSELLPYATPGFVAFGAGSLLTGWLGDRWSRRHMMVIFFVGIGASMIAVGLVQTQARTRRGAVVDRPVRVDLSSRRHRDDRLLCRPARPRDGPQRRLGQSRRGVVGAGHRHGRPVSRLALGLHHAGHRHDPDRRCLHVDGGSRGSLGCQAGRGAGAGRQAGHVAGDRGAPDRGDRDFHHLQRGDGGAAQIVRGAIERPHPEARRCWV